MGWYKEFLRAVALAAVLVAAQPATAGTFIFDINVTGREGGSGTFTPFTFQQTWSFVVPAGAGAITTTSSGSGYFATTTREGDINGSAIPTSSPMRGDLIAIASPIVEINSTIYATQAFRQYAAFPTLASADYALSFGSLGQYYIDDGFNRTSTRYQLGLSVQSGAPQEAAFRGITAFDESGIVQILSAGPLSYSELGERLGSNGSSGFTVQERSNYVGTANFRAFVPDASAVPEPNTWAMMLLGLGVIGASVRSRRRKRDQPYREVLDRHPARIAVVRR